MLSALVTIIIMNTIILFQSLRAAPYYCLSLRPVTCHGLCDLQLLKTRVHLNPGQFFLRNSSQLLIHAVFILYLAYWSTLPLFQPVLNNVAKNIFPLHRLNLVTTLFLSLWRAGEGGPGAYFHVRWWPARKYQLLSLEISKEEEMI